MNAQEQADYDAILAKVNTIQWNKLGKYGPEMEVGTELKWPGCRSMYLAVKDALHNKKVPGLTLYYYVGAIGNWGKAGFRISGHSKAAVNGKVPANCTTSGVLHIVYSPSMVVRESNRGARKKAAKAAKGQKDEDGWTTV